MSTQSITPNDPNDTFKVIAGQIAKAINTPLNYRERTGTLRRTPETPFNTINTDTKVKNLATLVITLLAKEPIKNDKDLPQLLRAKYEALELVLKTEPLKEFGVQDF